MDTVKNILESIFNYLRWIRMNHILARTFTNYQQPQHLPCECKPLNIQHGTLESKYHSYRGPSPLIVFILGPPGAGKGTQSTALWAKFGGLTHLSFGDLIRHHSSIPGDWVTIFPRRYGKEGNHVLPADAAVQLLRQKIEDGVRKGQMTWLIDGFPRNEKHVTAWLKQMPPAQCTFYLYCDADILMKRISERADGSGRKEDKDLHKARERVERSLRDSPAMLDALEANGMQVVRINTNSDVETIEGKIFTHFQRVQDDWKRKSTTT